MRRPIRFAARVAAGVAAGAVAALTVGVFGAGVASAAPAQGDIRGAGAAGAIKDSYIVVFKDSSAEARRVPTAATEMAARYGGSVHRFFGTAVPGFTVRASEAKARQLAANPAVAYVEQDRQVHIAGTQTSPPSWGLDRLDQQALPLSKSYTYPSTAANVTAYVIDTGVRLSHTDLAGRVRSGYDFVDTDTDASDCQGHGTHVAGTIAGTSHGVAKAAKIVAVRVLDCTGSGTYSAIIAGVDWVTKNAVKPAVANMSLGGSTSAALDTAVRTSIASGVTYAVAAGNDNVDACTKSPAHTTEAITVAATDPADTRASFSNYGTCVDIFAPGVNIVSAANSGDTGTATMSGTSMATPHVAGAAALVLAATPTATPAQVAATLTSTATTGKVAAAGTGTPTLLLHTGTPAPTTPPATTPPAAPAPCTATTGTDKTIPDLGTADSPLTLTGCTGTASATSKVAVTIKHTWRGDLVLSLIAPDGSSYKLKGSAANDSAANINTTYTVNLSTETRNGTWKLRAQDVAKNDTGYIDTWTLTL
jgi:subtilisin family serine protease